ncbi:hypothetical protein ACFXTH_046534 [Malus domestica]
MTLANNPPSPYQGQVETMIDKHADPFSEAPVNMINLASAEKGKGKVAKETEEARPADKSTKGVIKLPEHPKATIIKWMVLCSRCQCECELEIPPTRRLRGDSQPRALSEVFRNQEASEEAEAKEAKGLKEREIRHPQYGHAGREDKRNDRITNPVKKDNPARLGRKWYVVGKNGQPTKQMGASMIRRVQRQHKAYMNSLKTPATSEASKNQKFEKTSSRGSSQFNWRSKKEVERANSKTEGEGNYVPQSLHHGKYRILKRPQEYMIMMPTPGWRTEPICFGTVSPERKLPSISLVDPFGEVPKQIPDLGINQQQGAPEPLLPEDAMVWLDEFMGQIESKK